MIDILCKDIIRRLKINRIVETGTDKGETISEIGQWFSEIDPNFGVVTGTIKTGARSYNSWNEPIAYPVFSASKAGRYQIHSVDIDQYSTNAAKKNFSSNSNIYLYHSHSEKFLNFLLSPEIEGGHLENNYLFFLDAHWGKDWPLRDELRVILKLNKFLIVIDDFMVPGKSDPSFPQGSFGFDFYKGQILNWAYIADVLSSTRVKVFYPTRPNRDKKGWVLIAHGYSDHELKFLESLELFQMDQFDERHTHPVKPSWRSYWTARSILKKVVPVSLLRSAHRVYEKALYRAGSL